jgi:hypothetical protein
MSETIVCIKLNWALQIQVAAAYCYQLEYQSPKLPPQQTAEHYNLIPSENFFARLEQQHEIALFCLVEALNQLSPSNKVVVVSSNVYLQQTLETMPGYVQRNYLENHRYEQILRQLWSHMQQHRITFILEEHQNKGLQALQQQAKKKLQG